MSSQVTFKIRYSLSQEWRTEGSNDREGGRGSKVIAQQGKDSTTGLTKRLCSEQGHESSV